MHRAHAHVVGGRQVALIILEHCAARGVHPVQCKHRLKSRAFGFGQEIRVFDAVDRIARAASTRSA